MLSIIQLKFFSSSKIDLFNCFKFNHLFSMFVEDDTNRIKSYTLKKMIDKRFIACRKPEYLIRWKGYDSEKDVWRSLSEMKNVMNLIKDYEEMIKNITYLFGRLNTFVVIVPYRKFFTIVFKFIKALTPSFKASTTSSEMIHRNSLMIISASLKSSLLSLQKTSASFSFSSKTFASLRQSSRLFRRFSRLLLTSLWWWIEWIDDMRACWRKRQLSFFLIDKCYDYSRKTLIIIVKDFGRHLPISKLFRETPSIAVYLIYRHSFPDN